MKLLSIFAIGAALMLCATSCKTTEANYRAAYDLAASKAKEGIGEENYNRIQAEALKANAVVAGDSVRMKKMYVSIFDKPEEGTVHRYCVVVWEFKQQANATSLRDRLKAEGHKAWIARASSTSTFLVVAESFDTPEEAAAFVRDAKKRIKIQVNLDKIYILDKFR